MPPVPWPPAVRRPRMGASPVPRQIAVGVITAVPIIARWLIVSDGCGAAVRSAPVRPCVRARARALASAVEGQLVGRRSRTVRGVARPARRRAECRASPLAIQTPPATPRCSVHTRIIAPRSAMAGGERVPGDHFRPTLCLSGQTCAHSLLNRFTTLPHTARTSTHASLQAGILSLERPPRRQRVPAPGDEDDSRSANGRAWC